MNENITNGRITLENFNDSLNFKSVRLIDKLEVKILFGVIMGILCLVTTVGNIIVIFRYRKGSFVGNLFIISLACADLIVGCFVMPLASIYAVTEIWTLSLPVCQIWLSADYTASTASILNLFTLSLDRYWSITSPLKYLGKRTKSRALIMISIAWSISLLWLVPIMGWSYLINNGVRYVPDDKCNTEYDKNLMFKLTTAICNFYLPLILMIAINTKVYLVIRKRYHSPIMKYTSAPNNRKFLEKSTCSDSGINSMHQSSIKFKLRKSLINKDNNANNNDLNNEDILEKQLFELNKTFTQQIEINNYKAQKQKRASLISNRKNSLVKNINKEAKKTYFLSNSSTIKITPTKKFFSYLICFRFHFHNRNNDTKNSPHSNSSKNIKCNNCKNFLKTDSDQTEKKNFYLQKKKNSNNQTINRNLINCVCENNENEMNKNEVVEEKKMYRSVLKYFLENRNLSADHLQMSRFLYHDKLKDAQPANNESGRASPIFIRNDAVLNEPKTDEPNIFTNDSHRNSSSSFLRNFKTKLFSDQQQQNRSSFVSNSQNSEEQVDMLNERYTKDKYSSGFLESKLKNRRGFMNKQEKAFKQLAAIVIGFTLCFLPYFIVFLIVAVCEDCVSQDVSTVTVWLGYLNSTINPFLYALSNKRRFLKSINKQKNLKQKDLLNCRELITSNTNIFNRSMILNRNELNNNANSCYMKRMSNNPMSL